NRILGELQLDAVPRLLVFNKIDLVEPEELENRRRVYNAIPISAIDRSTLGTLADEISQRLVPDATEAEGQVRRLLVHTHAILHKPRCLAWRLLRTRD